MTVDYSIRLGTLRFDGGGQAPGPISGGVVIELPGREPIESSFTVTTGTHNVAEYLALEHGLSVADALGVTHLTIYGDSRLVVEQVNGRWKCRQQHLRPLLADVQDLLRAFENWTLQHVPRELNKDADRVASTALATLKTHPVEPTERSRK